MFLFCASVGCERRRLTVTDVDLSLNFFYNLLITLFISFFFNVNLKLESGSGMKADYNVT